MKRKIACFMLIIFMSFNIYELDLNTRKVNIIQPAHAIEPLTAYFISSAIAGLALSLGYQLVNSTSDSFTQGCMTLYNNFTTNTKALIDRIAGRKQAGDSTYDVTPEELESFSNELSDALSYDFNGTYTAQNVKPSLTRYGQVYNQKIDCREMSDLKPGVYDLVLTFYDSTDNIIISLNRKYQLNNNNTFSFPDTGSEYKYNGYPEFNFIYTRSYEPFPNDCYIMVSSSNSPAYQWLEYSLYGTMSYFTIQFVNYVPSTFNDIQVGQMNISELIVALQASGALNSQGAVTQQFISNYDTAVPSDVYTDLEAKTVVDGLFDGADTNVPDVPQDWGIVQSLYQVLQNIYSSVKTGFSNVYSKVASIATSISDIFAYDPALTVDLSGFNNLVIKEKFPFSIPFDLYNAIKLFSASAAEPQFIVSIHNKFLDIEHEIDISFLSTFILFFRWVASVWFTIFLIIKTRDMIKW